ncbi:MAG: MmcQ/YjbR family DNA-binding protein [bacterium]
MSRAIRKAENALLDFALSLPGAREDHPWGECVVKVGKKIFVFFGRGVDGKGLGLSVKLPASSDLALALPFARPTGYGLGNHDWVSASFQKGDAPPVELLREWIEESYRAIAPKKLVAQLPRSID